jgi:hypothetical protein
MPDTGEFFRYFYNNEKLIHYKTINLKAGS